MNKNLTKHWREIFKGIRMINKIYLNISYDEKCIVIPSQSVRYIELDADKKLSRINFF
jgi:hypothetical protein